MFESKLLTKVRPFSVCGLTRSCNRNRRWILSRADRFSLYGVRGPCVRTSSGVVNLVRANEELDLQMVGDIIVDALRVARDQRRGAANRSRDQRWGGLERGTWGL